MNGMMEGVAMGNSQLATNSVKELGGAMGAGMVNSAGKSVQNIQKMNEENRTEQIAKNKKAIEKVQGNLSSEGAAKVHQNMDSRKFNALSSSDQQILKDAGFRPVSADVKTPNAAQTSMKAFTDIQERIAKADENRRLSSGNGTTQDFIRACRTNKGQNTQNNGYGAVDI